MRKPQQSGLSSSLPFVQPPLVSRVSSGSPSKSLQLKKSPAKAPSPDVPSSVESSPSQAEQPSGSKSGGPSPGISSRARSTRAEPQARRSLNLVASAASSQGANSEEKGEGDESEDGRDIERAKQHTGKASAEAGSIPGIAVDDRARSEVQRVNDGIGLEKEREMDAESVTERHTNSTVEKKPFPESEEPRATAVGTGQRDGRDVSVQHGKDVAGGAEEEEEEGIEDTAEARGSHSEAAKNAKTTFTTADAVTPLPTDAVTSTTPASDALTVPQESTGSGLQADPDRPAAIANQAGMSGAGVGQPEVPAATVGKADMAVDGDVEDLRKLLMRERQARAAGEQALMNELTWLKEEGKKAEERLRAELVEAEGEREEALRKLEEEIESGLR